MIKNIIFDIGNVLAKFRWREFLTDLGITGEAQECVAAATVRNAKMWNEFDRSLLSDEEIISSCVSQAPQYESEIHRLFDNIRDIVSEYPYAATWIAGLKQRGFGVYLLSNYGRTAFEAGKSEFQFLKLVDGAVISYEVHQIKPEPGIYKALLEKYSLAAEECIFLDDREENIEAAKRLGFHGVVVTSREQAAKELEELIAAAGQQGTED